MPLATKVFFGTLLAGLVNKKSSWDLTDEQQKWKRTNTNNPFI
jgi:hypothetical protein